jgi:hypothetical protein
VSKPVARLKTSGGIASWQLRIRCRPTRYLDTVLTLLLPVAMRPVAAQRELLRVVAQRELLCTTAQ